MQRFKPYLAWIVKSRAVRAVFLICIITAVLSSTSFGQHQQFNNILGEWIRMDGGYVIKINDIRPDGTVQAAYFNPASIHVSESRVSMWKGLVRLLIKLEDKGYPGSTYKLFYHTKKDALAGFYYQAELEKTFEVVFLRKTTD
jgi:hypothetical protein